MNDYQLNSFDSFSPDMTGIIVVSIVIYLYFTVVLMLLARKTRTSGSWMAPFPMLNLVLLCRVADMSLATIIGLVIPCVNIIVLIVAFCAIARRCGKPGWMGLLVLIPGLGLLVPLYFALGSPVGCAQPIPLPPLRGPVPPPPVSAVCPACGRTECVGEMFCGYTGTQIGPWPSAASPMYPPTPPPPPPRPPAGKSGCGCGTIMVILLVLAVLVVGGAVVAYQVPAVKNTVDSVARRIKEALDKLPATRTGTSVTVFTAFTNDYAYVPRIEPTVPTPAKGDETVAASRPRIRFSDSFQRLDAAPDRLGNSDNKYGGDMCIFYVPLVSGANRSIVGARILGNSLENNSLDYGGVQFALGPNLRGANIGAALSLQVDLYVPTGDKGAITQAGPYFRSRAAAAGDGIYGGESAGYFVSLHSTGQVKVRLLNGTAPRVIVASTVVPTYFDSTRYHRMTMSASGDQLQVVVDGYLLPFEQDGVWTTIVQIPDLWNVKPAIGSNDGAAGIWFAADDNRGRAGGQRATNLVVAEWYSLANYAVPQDAHK